MSSENLSDNPVESGVPEPAEANADAEIVEENSLTNNTSASNAAVAEIQNNEQEAPDESAQELNDQGAGDQENEDNEAPAILITGDSNEENSAAQADDQPKEESKVAVEQSKENEINEANIDIKEITLLPRSDSEIDLMTRFNRLITSPKSSHDDLAMIALHEHEELLDQNHIDDDLDSSFVLRLSREPSLISYEGLKEFVELGELIRVKSLPTVPLKGEEEEEEEDPVTRSKAALKILKSKSKSINEFDAPVEIEIDREELLGKIQILLERRDKARAKNLFLQQKLGEYFKRKRADENRDSEKASSDWELRYANSLSSLTQLRQQMKTLNEENQQIIDHLTSQLEAKKVEADTNLADFVDFRKKSLISSESTRTTKGVPPKVIEQIEAVDTKKEQDIFVVRLENIKLRNKIRRQEQLLRQKEELGDGLHLIDFEQLKIENQAYNEKIEERNEVLTHIKEKLHFLEIENHDLRGRLKEIDDTVSAKRDDLPILKSKRDSLRISNTNLRQKNGLLGNTDLLIDFERKKDLCEELELSIGKLQEKYNSITATSNEVKRQIQKIKLNNRMETFGLVS